MAGLAISRVQKKRNLEFSKNLAGNEAFGRSDMSVKNRAFPERKALFGFVWINLEALQNLVVDFVCQRKSLLEDFLAFGAVFVYECLVADAAEIDQNIEPCALYSGFEVEGCNTQIACSVGVGAA